MDEMTVEAQEAGARVMQLPLAAIRPNPEQPRQQFDATSLAELAASLREHGVLQPVLVRPLDNRTYQLIAGERRWQAARLAGLETLPALVVRASAQRALELALVENVQRADLNPLEEAEAYRALMAALGLTQERLAERLGISRVAVANRLRLLALSVPAREALLAGRITEGHARALLALQGAAQEEALRVVERGHLSVRETERLARRMAVQKNRRRGNEPDVEVEALAERLCRALGARVRARRLGAGVVVSIQFHAPDAAYRLLDTLDPDGGDDL